MKHLQTFKMFESTTGLTPEQIQFLDDFAQGPWSQDPTTREINVKGDFVIPDNYTRDFKGLRFGQVTGDFHCSFNSLTSLEGAPTTVGGDFWCRYSSLTSLEGAPTTVEGRFICSFNSLTSLEGAPSTVEGNFRCSHNFLTSLEGAPTIVGGDFDCFSNSLTSLEGAPEVIKGKFYSDDLDIPKGEWGLPKFLEILATGTEKQKQLILPLVDPKMIQGKIDQDPEKMAIILKEVIKEPYFKSLRWPENLKDEVDLLSSLSDIGL